jgi:hypothetical protein
VVVTTQLPRWPYPTTPASSLPAQIRRAIPAGDPVALTYPYPRHTPGAVQVLQDHTDPMLWQLEDNFDFRLLGGYAIRSGTSADANQDVNAGALAHAHVDPAPMDPRGLQQFLAYQEGITAYGCPTPVDPRGLQQFGRYKEGITSYGCPPLLYSGLVGVTHATVSNYKIKVIIVDRSVSGSGPVVTLFGAAFGPPTIMAGSFLLWDV